MGVPVFQGVAGWLIIGARQGRRQLADGLPCCRAVGVDVTEQRRSAEVQRVAGLGYWEWDIPGNHVSWSDEVYAIFGFDRAGFRESYEALLERVHPEDRAAVMATVDAALADGRPYCMDHRILLPDGSERTVQEQAQSAAAAGGAAAHRVRGGHGDRDPVPGSTGAGHGLKFPHEPG